MTALTNYAEDQCIAKMFRGDATDFPTTWYVGLLTAAPGEAGGGTEVTGGNYARVAVADGTGNFAATSAGNGTTSNVSAVPFPTPSASWGTVTNFAIYDAPSAGNMWIYSPLTQSKVVNIGDTVTFPPGSMTFQIDN